MYRRMILLLTLPAAVLLFGTAIHHPWNDTGIPQEAPDQPVPHPLFQTADACISCHTGIVTPAGEDISFGIDWRASMMANSARDPYWHAAVRREITDHPESRVVIEEECSTCHMPMSHYESAYNGQVPGVFEHLPVNSGVSRSNLLAADGVSCTTCHQIKEDNFGLPESFVGRFAIDTLKPMGQREIYGPYPVDPGRANIMHSSSGFLQSESTHLQRSEMCATCHTLITKSLGPGGEVIGELPEQVPYLEWRHSSFLDEQSCQSCHMPVVEQPVPITSVLGQPRNNVSRHSFRGGNFFMMKILNRFRGELGVKALPAEMDLAVNRTIEHLQTRSARVSLGKLAMAGDELEVEVRIENLAGHKLPTAYPSRRTWIHFSVLDDAGNTVFESGALHPDGSIAGNDNDEASGLYEPHYTEITDPSDVQIYETIMVDPSDEVTTGLLTAVRFIKDNRILPKGFDKTTAGEMIEVQGRAVQDGDFIGGNDTVVYRFHVGESEGSLHIRAELWYQPIGFRWARNLVPYDTPETNRFVSYYNGMSGESAVILAEASRMWREN